MSYAKSAVLVCGDLLRRAPRRAENTAQRGALPEPVSGNRANATRRKAFGRAGRRLRYVDLDVPSLVLQPLVENAIRHAIEGWSYAIQAAQSNGRLTVRIEDDGPGFSGGDPFSSKTRSRNTKARLEHLYGSGHEIQAPTLPLAAPS